MVDDRALAQGRTLVGGRAEGPAVVLREPLSFWGGLDPATGVIVDRHHPQRGARVAGCVLVLPAGRGSSSSSSVLAEALRAGTGPAAIVLAAPDAIVALGAIVARELYGVTCAVVAVGDAGTAALAGPARLRVDAAGPGATVGPSSDGSSSDGPSSAGPDATVGPSSPEGAPVQSPPPRG